MNENPITRLLDYLESAQDAGELVTDERTGSVYGYRLHAERSWAVLMGLVTAEMSVANFMHVTLTELGKQTLAEYRLRGDADAVGGGA